MVVIIHIINLAQIITIIAEYTKNSLNSLSYTIENIKLKNCEKFSPIERQNWHFLKCHGYCYTNSVNCSYTKASKQQLTVHISIVKENYNKVLQTHASSFQTHTLMFTGVVNLNESITQNRNQINYLQNRITTKTQHNGSFFSHKK